MRLQLKRATPSQGQFHRLFEQLHVAVLQVLPSDQEHVVLPLPFPQDVQFRASQSGATQLQVPSEHNAASLVPKDSSDEDCTSLGSSSCAGGSG